MTVRHWVYWTTTTKKTVQYGKTSYFSSSFLSVLKVRVIDFRCLGQQELTRVALFCVSSTGCLFISLHKTTDWKHACCFKQTWGGVFILHCLWWFSEEKKSWSVLKALVEERVSGRVWRTLMCNDDVRLIQLMNWAQKGTALFSCVNCLMSNISSIFDCCHTQKKGFLSFWQNSLGKKLGGGDSSWRTGAHPAPLHILKHQWSHGI